MDSKRKLFRIAGDQIKQLIPYMGSCYASDRITVDGLKVGYMYREVPDSEIDSGWRFFSGDESQEYTDNPANFGIYDVNTICNYDPAIIPYLDTPESTAIGRVPGTNNFRREPQTHIDG